MKRALRTAGVALLFLAGFAGAGHLRRVPVRRAAGGFAGRGGATRRGRGRQAVCWRCSSSAPPCSGVSAACGRNSWEPA